MTFLFTDIVGSTRLWEHHRSAMADLVAAHDEVLRSAVSRNRGYVFATGGDSIAAAFQSPTDAITAAVEGQRELASLEGSLEVRMGLHTGVAEERDGDYFGPSVNRCARLMSAASGGQILVSLATAEVSRDWLPPGVELIELGRHRLPSVGRPEHVHQVGHPDLPRDFPALAVPAVGSRLPLVSSTLVGRSPELASLSDLLTEHRLVTIVGPGGVGKTRLAVEAGRTHVDARADGVWFADLSQLRDAELVDQHVAALLGIDVGHGRSVADRVVRQLAGRDLLLVLDNCEHVGHAVASLVGRLLRETAGPTVLATSRAPLGVDGEKRFPLAPLRTDSEQAGAVELFLDRVGGAAELPPDSLPDVVELCHRLDGLPLAIELAASRASVLHPRDIVARMARSPSLSVESRHGDDRHRTIDAAIAWSYDLLSPSARRTLERVAVFAAGFDVEDAEAVVSGDGIATDEVLDLLLELNRNSLVRTQPDATDRRLHLLETIREFATARLEERDEADAVRVRFLEHAVAIGRRAAERLGSGDDHGWHDLLDRQHANLQAAIARGIDAERWEEAASLIRDLATWWAWHHPSMGLHWSERFVEAAPPPPGIRASVLAVASRFAWLRGDQLTARSRAEEALALCEAHGLTSPSWAIGSQALCELFDGDPAGRAVSLALRAVELARTDGDDIELALQLPVAAMCLGFTGTPEAGLPFAAEALAAARRAGVQRTQVEAELLHGCVLAQTGSERAGPVLDRALPLTTELQMPWLRATGSLFRAIATIRADPGGAVPALTTAVVAAADVHDVRALFGTAEVVVGLARRLGRPELAAHLLGAVVEERTRAGGLRGAPTELRARERTTAALRAELGPRFDELVETGRHTDEDVGQLTLDVLRQLEPAVVPSG